MNFEQAIKTMRELNAPHVKVIDISGKRIIDFTDEPNVEATIIKLNDFISTLRTFGRVNFIVATDSIKKQNWKDAYHWQVTFDGIAATPQNNNANNNNFRVPAGYISEREAILTAQLEALKLQMNFQKQIDELTTKLATPKKEPGFEKYLPMLALIPGFELTEDKIMNMMRLSQMGNMMQPMTIPTQQTQQPQQTNAMAGLPSGKDANGNAIELTEEEKKQVEELNNNIDALSEKVDMQTLINITKAFNEDPQKIELAKMFLNNNK